MIISPSVLSANFFNLSEELNVFRSQKDTWLHLDIMDGHFVPNLTFGTPLIASISKNTNLPLDAHLMVTNPEFYADEFKNLNIHNFTFHWETVVHHDRFISYLKTMFPSVGISFNPSTSLNIVPSYIWKLIDLVLIMSVNPGFGGQSFIESSIEKVEYLAHLKKQKNLHFQIQVDGGVNLQNAHKLKLAGANNLVAGSYIFSQGDSNLNHQDRLIAQLNSLK